jgi:hypothetical protein
MAAKPIERFVKQQIAQQGGWPRILERIASGETVADVARSLKRPDGQEISRSFFSHLLHADEERSKAVLKARDEGSDAMVDHGLHLVDSAQPDRDSINKAKVQAEMRLKVAGFINRERWGERKQDVTVEVNMATVHLDSLRHRIIEASRPLAALLAQDSGAPSASSATDPHACDTVSDDTVATAKAS